MVTEKKSARCLALHVFLLDIVVAVAVNQLPPENHRIESKRCTGRHRQGVEVLYNTSMDGMPPFLACGADFKFRKE